MDAALEAARRRADVPLAATDQDNADLAERVPGSLISATLVQINLEGRKLNLIPVDGVTPSIEAFEAGTYRYGKKFHLAAAARPSAAVRNFLAFIGSPQGREILRWAGVIE
jgi:phosphate transport system substrate-binding protein